MEPVYQSQCIRLEQDERGAASLVGILLFMSVVVAVAVMAVVTVRRRRRANLPGPRPTIRSSSGFVEVPEDDNSNYEDPSGYHDRDAVGFDLNE